MSGLELLGVAFWDCVILGGAGIVYRVRRWLRHHRVPHYKLRRVAGRHPQADRVHHRGAAVIGDTRRAASPPRARESGLPGAGPNARTVDHLQGDVPTAVRPGSHVEPNPRPGLLTLSLGAGLNPGSSTASRDSAGTSREAAGAALGSGDPGPKRQSPPVPPDLAVTGPQLPAMAQIGWKPHPRGEEAGAACPRLAAPAGLPHD